MVKYGKTLQQKREKERELMLTQAVSLRQKLMENNIPLGESEAELKKITYPLLDAWMLQANEKLRNNQKWRHDSVLMEFFSSIMTKKRVRPVCRMATAAPPRSTSPQKTKNT